MVAPGGDKVRRAGDIWGGRDQRKSETFVLLLGSSFVTFYREPQRPTDSAPLNRWGHKRLGE